MRRRDQYHCPQRARRSKFLKRWDVGDPVAASTMLQRFLHSDVGYVERARGLTESKTMIEEQTRYYEGADATLYDLFQSHAEHKFTDAAKLFVHGQTPNLQIDGKVVDDLVVLNAVKALNLAQNPLTTDNKTSHEAFAYSSKPTYNNENVLTLTNHLEALQDQYLANLEAESHTRDPTENSTPMKTRQTVANTTRRALKPRLERERRQASGETPVNQPLMRSISLWRARQA